MNDGESEYTIGIDNGIEEVESISDEEKKIFEGMNIDLIHLKEFQPEMIIVSKINPHGGLMEEVGEFDVYKNRVLVPEDIRLEGFNHFELVFEEGTMELISEGVKPPKHHKEKMIKERDHRNKKKQFNSENPHQGIKIHYVLGPKEKAISDETMYLVFERGYLLAPSYKFVSHRFFHDEKLGKKTSVLESDENLGEFDEGSNILPGEYDDLDDDSGLIDEEYTQRIYYDEYENPEYFIDEEEESEFYQEV